MGAAGVKRGTHRHAAMTAVAAIANFLNRGRTTWRRFPRARRAAATPAGSSGNESEARQPPARRLARSQHERQRALGSPVRWRVRGEPNCRHREHREQARDERRDTKPRVQPDRVLVVLQSTPSGSSPTSRSTTRSRRLHPRAPPAWRPVIAAAQGPRARDHTHRDERREERLLEARCDADESAHEHEDVGRRAVEPARTATSTAATAGRTAQSSKLAACPFARHERDGAEHVETPPVTPARCDEPSCTMSATSSMAVAAIQRTSKSRTGRKSAPKTPVTAA